MSNRTTLVTIDFENEFDRFGDESAGVWQSTLAKSQTDRDASFWGAMGGTWSASLPFGPVLVGSVRDKDVFYPRLTTLSDLKQAPYGFYFDSALQICYIKTPLLAPWYTRELLDYGESLIFSDSAGHDREDPTSQAYIDGILTEPRLVTSSVRYNRTADPLGDNRMNFDPASVSLVNADGALDNLRNRAIGRSMRVYISDAPRRTPVTSLSEFISVTDGRVSKVTFSGGTNITVRAEDGRFFWENYIRGRELTDTEFPDIGDREKGRFAPIIVGAIRLMPLINVSSNGDNRTWLVHDPIPGQASLTTVYDDNGAIAPAGYTYTASTGVIVFTTAPTGDARASVAGPTVPDYIAGTGRTDNAADVAIWALETFASLPYLASFYDVDGIPSLYGSLVSVGYWTGTTGIKVKDFVDRILSSANLRIFYREIQDAGGIVRTRYSIRTLSGDNSGTSSDLENTLPLYLPLKRDFAEKESFTRVIMGWDYDFYNQEFDILKDSSKEQAVLADFPIEREYQFQTYCTNAVQAAGVMEARYAEGTVVPYRLSGTLGEPLPFNLLDYINYHHVRYDDVEILPPALWRVTKLDRIGRTFELSYIQDLTGLIPAEIRGIMYNMGRAYLQDAYGSIENVS